MANRKLTTPHKIVTRLWLAVWRWYTRFLMYKKWSIWWKNKRQQPAAIIHSSRRFSHRRRTITTCFLTNNASDDFTKSSFYKFSCLSRTLHHAESQLLITSRRDTFVSQEQHHLGAINRIHSEYKCMVLATKASTFDPLGLLSPAVIAYKIFLQKLWQDNLQWDELLPSHLQQEWN